MANFAAKGTRTDDFFSGSGRRRAQRLVCDLVRPGCPLLWRFDPIKNIPVLCPTKLDMPAQALNTGCGSLLNPPAPGKARSCKSAARVFRVGDKVMQVRNNYELVCGTALAANRVVGAYSSDIGIVGPSTCGIVRW